MTPPCLITIITFWPSHPPHDVVFTFAQEMTGSGKKVERKKVWIAEKVDFFPSKNNNINTNLTVAFRSLGKTFFDHKYLKWDQYNKQSHNNDINRNNNKTATITTTTTTVASESVC